MTNNVLDTAQIKQINIQLILDALMERDTLTKQDISAFTGLGLSTCTALLSELIANQQVTELAYAPPRGGRPARRFALNANAKHILCVIVQNWEGSDQVIWRVCDLKGTLFRNGAKAFEALGYAELEETIGSILSEDSAIQSIALGLPGIVANGSVESCDIPALSNCDLVRQLQKRFHMQILSENDLNVIAYGLSRSEKEARKPSVVAVAWPMDNYPGAGIVIDGRVLKGSTHFAGEVSHFPYPMSRAEQLEKLHDDKCFLPMAAQVLSGIISVINPESIAIIGKLATTFSEKQYVDACAQWIPRAHLPEFTLLSEPKRAYFKGLFLLGREVLSYPVRIHQRSE